MSSQAGSDAEESQDDDIFTPFCGSWKVTPTSCASVSAPVASVWLLISQDC